MFVDFVFFNGTDLCHISNPVKQKDNQKDKWLLLRGVASVFIFIFFLCRSIGRIAHMKIAFSFPNLEVTRQIYPFIAK